ncbi:MAG: cobyrinate a,c-diamide synthase, partial [Paracoccaceae bacterium]
MKGFVIAAPHSGAGKTMITLGLLRAFRNCGVAVTSAKSGPDYIDPQFHQAASGTPCVNLDAWAMPPDRLQGLAAAQDGDLLVVEGAMGLFDGAPSDDPMGRGSVADVAEALNLPVVLVLDAARQSQTAAAVVHGLASLRPSVKIAGVILNQIGSPRHGAMISRAIKALNIPVLGVVPRTEAMKVPSRHLGLVQAEEHTDLEAFIGAAAGLMLANVNLDRLLDLSTTIDRATRVAGLPPLGARISAARDTAFAFSYPHLLDDWRLAGAEVSFFSPLNDEGPAVDADAIFLPGGYPELYAGRLAQNSGFVTVMTAAKDRGALIYGECGGYMALGESLTDSDGAEHRMLGFLPVRTSFAARKLHLGYRGLTPICDLPWAGPLNGHEFHYASVIEESSEGRLFGAQDSLGENLGGVG